MPFDMTKSSKRFLDVFFSIYLMDPEETAANISKGNRSVTLCPENQSDPI